MKLLVQVLFQPPLVPARPTAPMTSSSAVVVVGVVPVEQLVALLVQLVAVWSSGVTVSRPEYSKMPLQPRRNLDGFQSIAAS
ncbi:MAG: hypothetical protein GY788_07925 [bacterium]|nr:hypothetical protein [bacterium]